MSGTTSTDLCRVTVLAPSGSADLAVPADVPLIDLMPTVLAHASGNLADSGLEHDGWVLQRLGDPPLDEDRTPAALGLRDGELLHLRPRADQLPTLDFDDVVDGVSAAMRERADGWRDTLTRRLFLGLTAAWLAVGLAVLLLPGPAGTRAVAGAAAGAVLVVLAAAASRALGDAPAGILLGLAALPYAGLAGLITPTAEAATAVGSASLVAAGAAVAAAALLAGGAVGTARPVFLAAGLAGTLAAGGALLATLTTLRPAQAAAVVAVTLLTLAPAVPTLSFRLARLQLPPLPRGPEDLQENIDPVPGDLVTTRAGVADRYMLALLGVVGAAALPAVTLLGTAGGGAHRALAGLICVLLLLRSRVLASGRQRFALLLPGVWGLSVLAVAAGAELSPSERAGAVLVVVAAAGLCLAAARVLPGRRLLPYWGRLADLSESLVGVGILPTLLAVLDVYRRIRALSG